MDQSSFTSYVGMGCNEIKELIIDKYSLLSDKLSGKLEQQEIDNQGYLLWNCKMILRNIYMSCDKLTSKFNSELTKELIDAYSKISNLIKEDEATWTSIENIKNTFEKIQIGFEILNKSSNEKESNESGFIRKTILDENGMEYEVEETFALPNFKQTKWLDKIAQKLQINLVDLSSNEKRLDEVNATYYWNSSRGGTSLIVADDGSYLGATSSVNFDKHLEEFKSGRRNGNFAATNENDIEKKKSVLSEIVKNIYSNHQEFVMKPPTYESPSKFFLLENENQFYVATILDKHIMNYPNSQSDNSQNNNYPINILVYNLDNNESSIYTYEDICKKYTFDFNSIDIEELLQKKSNIPALELIELKRNLASILDEIIQNKDFIDIEKYISEYLPKFLLTLSEKEIHLLIDGLSKKDVNKEFKINCRFCNNEIVIDSSKLPTNIKALDTMCPNCKSFIKYGNPNYVEDKDKTIECNHKWELTDKVPEISKEWQKSEDGTKKEVYYGIYKCSICGKEERLEIKDEITIPNNDDLQSILDNIFSKLTGDNKADTEYLNKVSEEYKNHPMSKEILREIGRKIFEILPNEAKEEFTKKYDEDINNIRAMLDEANSYIFGKDKDLEKAKSMLLDFIDGNMSFDNDTETEYYNFSDVIEFVIYTRINKTNKNIKWLDIPFVTAYSYLSYIYNEQKQYDKALEMIAKTCRWNPMALSPLFEKCETYKMQKDWETFYNITLSLYDKIYNARDLAHYYRNLGFYYIEKGNLDLAYALYTASTKFEKSNNAFAEMAYINQQLNRESYNMSAEEGINLLKQNNLSFGIKQSNLDLLVSIYVNEKELMSNKNVEMMLSSRIYELTFDKKFAPFNEVVDKITNCSIIVPKVWRELPLEKRTKQTIFAYITEQNVLFQAIHGGKCKIEDFDKAYDIEVKQIETMPNTKVIKQTQLELKLKQGIKLFKLALAEYSLLENKKIRILHAFTIINNIVVDFTIPVDININPDNEQEFNNQLNVKDLINVLFSIYEFSEDKNISNPIKQDPVLKEKMLDKIDNAIIHLTEQQFEEINTYYKNNKDIRKVFDFANETFKKATEEDVFWIVSSKEALIYIMVNILEEKGILKYDDLREILSNKDNFINICKNINANNEDKEYLRIVEHIKKATDNMLDSYYDIIKKYLKIVTPKEETVIYNLKFSNDSSVEITVPKKLGEFTHPTETSYKIGNDITVMNAKCNNVDLLKKRANEWLINSAKTNNQVLHDDLDKEYTLKRKSISVVEKVVSKDNKKRYYKFAYYDENMLIFGYNNDDLSNTINDIIISMKSKKEQVKVSRNPFEDPNNKTNGNDLSLVNVLVEKIKNMNDGESSSISKLLENKIDGINLFDIQKEVISKLNELDIELDYSKHDGKVTGLPFNLDFIKKSKNINLQFNLKIEHTPFHGTYGKLDELTVPQPIIEEYKVIEGLKIDLKDFKIEVLKINSNGIEIKVYDNKGILSSNNENSDIIVDYKNGDSIGSITLGKEIKLYKDVFDAGEYWNIYLYN